MRLLIVGKPHVMKWPENVLSEMEKHVTCRLFLYDKFRLLYLLSKIFGKKGRHAYLSWKFTREIKSFHPDAILFVSAFSMPVSIYSVMAKFPKIKTIGWSGDRFYPWEIEKGKYLNYLYCTDTGFLPVAKEWGLPCEYMPLCANSDEFFDEHCERIFPPLFVAGTNQKRIDYMKACQSRCLIFGPGWPVDQLPQHEVHVEYLPHDKYPYYAKRTKAAICLAFSHNNVNGLNFRPFELGACGTLIVTKDCPDLELCYDVSKEVVVFHNETEFNDVIRDILAHPSKYQKIAKAGYQRTIREHTYKVRCQKILQKFSEL